MHNRTKGPVLASIEVPKRTGQMGHHLINRSSHTDSYIIYTYMHNIYIYYTIYLADSCNNISGDWGTLSWLLSWYLMCLHTLPPSRANMAFPRPVGRTKSQPPTWWKEKHAQISKDSESQSSLGQASHRGLGWWSVFNPEPWRFYTRNMRFLGGWWWSILHGAWLENLHKPAFFCTNVIRGTHLVLPVQVPPANTIQRKTGQMDSTQKHVYKIPFRHIPTPF